MSSGATDFEALLREALTPVDPPADLVERLELTLVSLTALAQDELESWELSAMRDPRNWARPVAAVVVGVSAGTALVVLHGVDPRLQDRARALVRKLGDELPGAREAAEAQLFELGPVTVPVLEDALRDNDLEIVFRAERLLWRLNRQVP